MLYSPPITGNLENLQGLPDWKLEELHREVNEEARRRQFKRDWEASWKDLEARCVNVDQAVQNILESPTEEERRRWVGKTPEQIRTEIEKHVKDKASEHVGQLRFVAELDEIARQMHIEVSPRLAPYRKLR